MLSTWKLASYSRCSSAFEIYRPAPPIIYDLVEEGPSNKKKFAVNEATKAGSNSFDEDVK